MTTIVAPRAAEIAPHPMAGHNRPPLDEEVVIDFKEALAAHPGLNEKIAKLVERAKTAEPCNDGDMASKYGDFIKMVSTCEGLVDQARVQIKAPILAAQRALDGSAKGIADDLAAAKVKIKRFLDAFVAAENARVLAERRAAEQARQEAERIAREAAEMERRRLQAIADAEAEKERARLQAIEYARAEAERQRRQAIEDERAAAAGREAKAIAAKAAEIVVEAKVVEVLPEVFAEPAPVIDAPVFRGDLGSRVGVRTVWKHRIDSVRQLPDAILKHASVVEALDKVIAAQVRGGARQIKGATIWDEQQSSVR